MAKRLSQVSDLTPDAQNANRGTERGRAMLEHSLRQYGAGRSVLADKQGRLIAGNKTVEVAAELGLPIRTVETDGRELVVVQRRDLDLDTDAAARELAYADNRVGQVSLEWELAQIGADVDAGVDLSALWSEDELAALLAESDEAPAGADGGQDTRPSLSDRFLVPPFSVLDARQGYWQARKRQWLAIGIQSELGRGENHLDFSATVAGIADPDERAAWNAARRGLARTFGQDLMRGEHQVGEGHRLTWVQGNRPVEKLDETSRKILAAGRRAADQRSNLTDAPSKPEWAVNTGTENMAPGTSIFDPVLCEVVYRWFCPPAGLVLDPFAGGSVRGIVATILGHQYVGIDLSDRQIAANREQAATICEAIQPTWAVGDSRDVGMLAAGAYDFIFSCPPYADLERYSDDPRDLSTMEYGAFLADYRQIIAEAVALLRQDRFACFVVGDVRDRKGLYRNFVSDTIAAFHDAGAALYNEAVLITAIGSLPIRVGKQFSSARKLGKTHQNVLVFVKGDPKAATGACGPVVVDDALAAYAEGEEC